MDKENQSSVMGSEEKFKSTLVSRNITVLGHRTSVRLEPEMWLSLKEISMRERCTIHDICSLVHLRKNEKTSLTAAIRVFLMLYYRSAATEDGHKRAGHGDFECMKSRAKMPNDVKQVGRSNVNGYGRRNDNQNVVYQ